MFIGAARGAVVINEIMYHPPDDRDDLQWVELFNAGTDEVDITGWRFKKGIEFQFPSPTVLAPGGFVVVARDVARFNSHYRPNGVQVVGGFIGRLSHSGENISLGNASGKTIDSVHYGDLPPWPSGADGYSSSLERICPTADGRSLHNWAASGCPTLVRAAGTPGHTNDSFQPYLPPIVTNVVFTAVVAPRNPLRIGATVRGTTALTNVTLRTLSFDRGRVSAKQSLPMTRSDGPDRYEATLPAQDHGVLTRFWIEATDNRGSTRTAPSENEPRRSFSVLHFANTNTATVPFLYLIRTAPMPPLTTMRTPPPPEPARGNAAFIYAETNRGEAVFLDHVRLQERPGGWKVHFQHDRLFHGMGSWNVIYEAPRYALAEPLGHEVFRRCGVPAPETAFVRVYDNGSFRGLHLAIEQVNKTFLERRHRDGDGDLFKLVWFGRGTVGQHEKKTNPLTGHTNLLALLSALHSTRGDEQFAVIERNFNVDEFARYFAACQLIGNWDGYHNNHFLYDDLRATKRWEIYPWDLDKTFGDFDGAPSDYAWYDMPLTYGMEGDQSPPASAFKASRQQGGFGGVTWWRPGGPFSKPLLANARFRAEYEKRLRDLLAQEYTEQKLFPWLAAMEQQLEPEVRVRARGNREGEGAAVRELHHDIETLRNFITGRGKFLREELANK